mgnify:CR=1 FL=1
MNIQGKLQVPHGMDFPQTQINPVFIIAYHPSQEHIHAFACRTLSRRCKMFVDPVTVRKPILHQHGIAMQAVSHG